MIKEKPFIHLFKSVKGYYIYDVNTNSIIKTNKEVYDLLRNMLSNNSYKENIQEDYWENVTLKTLENYGFLKAKRVKEVIHPYNDILESYMSSKLKMMTLQVTQQCNLRCEYCAYSGNYMQREHKNLRMSLETAKKAIDFLIENSKDSEIVNIGFYGGEPLLEFQLVKDAISYAKSISVGKKLSFSFTTNGTLFTKEIIEYMMENKVMITISLDGPKEVHDKNRKFAVSGCGTFEKVMKNLQFFKDNYPEYFNTILFNAVFDRSNNFNCLNDFFAGYDLIKDSIINSSNVSTQYSKVDSIENEDYDIQLRYEIFKMYLSKLGRLNENKVSKLVHKYYDSLRRNMIDERLKTNSLKDKEHHGGPCVPGSQRLFVDVNGNFYPCERVSESSEVMRIGNVDSGFQYDKVRRLLNIGELTKESCVNCWAFRFCGMCAAYADNLDELSKEKKHSNCKMVRKSAEAQMKDYCMLNEFGYNFENDSVFTLMEV